MPRHTEKKIARSAGFIIVRPAGDGYRVLGLKVWGKFDIPKGKLDDNESDFEAAIRECEEEASISVTSTDMKWGHDSFTAMRPHKHVVIYLAETDQEPKIKPNPETGIYEHDSCEWLTWNQMLSGSYPYLKSAIEWARDKVDPKHSRK